MTNTKTFDPNKKIAFLARKLSTNEKWKVLDINFQDKTVVVAKNEIIELLKLDEVRLLADTRLRDSSGRKIFEHSMVEITRISGDKFTGIVVFNKAWGIMDYDSKTFRRFTQYDKLKKIYKK